MLQPELRTFTIFDANWADGNDIAQGSVVLDDSGKVIEYAIYTVEAFTLKEALDKHNDTDSDHTGEYTLDPVPGPAAIILPFGGS